MKDISSELFFRTARSGGKGGQHVNKVEIMAEAYWHVPASKICTPEEKEIIMDKLANRISKEGYLIVRSSETRSQLENKAIAQQKLAALVAQALIKPKSRKPTKPSKAMVAARLRSKKQASEKKASRRKDFFGD